MKQSLKEKDTEIAELQSLVDQTSLQKSQLKNTKDSYGGEKDVLNSTIERIYESGIKYETNDEERECLELKTKEKQELECEKSRMMLDSFEQYQMLEKHEQQVAKLKLQLKSSAQENLALSK